MSPNIELHKRVYCGDLEGVKQCVKNGADVNCKLTYDSFTGLSDIEHFNLPSGCLATALLTACKEGYFEIVKFLLENGADANAGGVATYTGLTYIPLVAAFGNWADRFKKDKKDTYLAIIEILVEYGAEVAKIEKYYDDNYKNYKDEEKYKSLMALIKQASLLGNVKSGNLEKIRQCLASGMDVNFVYAFSKTALMYACQKGNFEVALTLISAGANINAKDKSGKTVLNYAAEGGNAEIMKLLLAQGADTGAKSE